MKLFLLFLGLTLVVCKEHNVHWEKSSSMQYQIVNGKPVQVIVDNKPMTIVTDQPKPDVDGKKDNSSKAEDQGKVNVTKNSEVSKMSGYNYPMYPNMYHQYPNQYPQQYPQQYPFPQVDPGFGRPDLWYPSTYRPYDPNNEDPDFQLRGDDDQ